MKRAYEPKAPDTDSARHWHPDIAAEPFLFRHSPSPITVLLVDDHEVVRTGCRLALENTPDIKVVAEAGDGYAGCTRYREHAPDVVLLDLNMPGIDGIETIRRIKAQDPKARILAFSSHIDTRLIQRVLDAGATGYLNKRDSLQIAEAIRKAAREEMPWT